jgi:hypothetical protein
MKIIKKIQQEVSIIDDIFCNKCGRSCRPEEKSCPDFYGLIEVSFTTGYESRALPDGMSYCFSLCEECLAELFKSFKIDPEVTEFF